MRPGLEESLSILNQPADAAAMAASSAGPHVYAGAGMDVWMMSLRPRLVALARRFLWNAHDAEEVTQEALMLAWKHATELIPATRNAWVYRTTINLCLSRLRRKRAQLAPMEDLVAPATDPARSETLSELAGRVRMAICELPELLRVALVLRDLEGLDYRQISAIVHARPATLRLRVHRARETVRQTLLERWPDSFGTDR